MASLPLFRFFSILLYNIHEKLSIVRKGRLFSEFVADMAKNKAPFGAQVANFKPKPQNTAAFFRRVYNYTDIIIAHCKLFFNVFFKFFGKISE